jgi:hypothetical protein
MNRRLLGILICGICLSGCAVHEAHKDHDLIRSTLLDLYTNQIMDNLVRTSNGLPIIQLDYTNASAQVTLMSTIGTMDNQATTATNLLNLPAATLAATRTLMTTLAGNASATNSNQVSIGAVPLITSNDVYDAYISYMDSEKNPDGLKVTCNPPPKEVEPLCKKFNGMYYWVPTYKRKEFFALALATTAQRGKALQAPDKFYTISLDAGPTLIADSKGFSAVRNYTYDITKLKIPADSGYLVLDSDTANPQTQFDIQAIPPKTNPGDPVPSTAATLEVSIPADTVELLPDEAGTMEPKSTKNLYYVSLKNDKLHFVVFDANQKRTEYDEESLKDPKQVKDIKTLREKLVAMNWEVNPKIPRQANEVKKLIRSICNLPFSKESLFTTPLKGKLFLNHNAPTVPSTADALDRVNFQLQQIQFNLQRQLSQ